MLITTALAALLALGAAPATTADSGPLATVSERSGFRSTGRYEEVARLCAAFQNAYPDAVRCFEFGRTPEGRPMLALAASRRGALDATQAHHLRLPVVLIQGGIHAGEIDGKDAGFLALREVLEGKVAPSALEHEVLLFVPVFNVDGHERFGRWNRPNQNGPEEMGWRTTAQNLNLNRDYAKAESPEMQAMLRLVNEWDPILTVDLHVTDGAKFEHDIAIQVEPGHAGDAQLRVSGRALREAVIADLRAQGSLPLPFYPSFLVTDDPSSGFTDGVSTPRFSTGYFHTRNRFAMLVETHSWKDYPTRVRITRNTIISVLARVASNGSRWLRQAREADRRSAALAGKSVPLDYLASDKVRTIEFRGYAYTRASSEISGKLMTRYDDSRPQLWRIPLRDDVQPSITAVAPVGGYLVPAAHAGWVAAKLARHAISFRVLGTESSDREVEVFRASKSTLATASVEGRQRNTVEGAWRSETRALSAGVLFVPIGQPKARLVMALLEPTAPDSLVAWGDFNNAFEQKEYMEDYVAEDVARQQLAADLKLAAEFATRLRDDPAFAADPAARLQFFARRHASWDDRYNQYPIWRTASVPR